MSNTENINQFVFEKKSDQYLEPFRKNIRRKPVGSPAVSRSSGLKRQYDHFLFTPVHYEPNYAYPLLVWFHSPGADETELFRVMPKISLQNFVAIAPRGLTQEESGTKRVDRFRSVDGNVGAFSPLYDWYESDEAVDEVELRFVEAVERARLCCNIAPRRVFLAGIGVGGSMAMRIGTRYPDSVAGVVSFSGGFQLSPCSLVRWGALRQLPIMMMFGVKNPVFSSAAVSEQLRLFHTAGMSVSIRQYKTAEDVTPVMFKDANKWMMEQFLDPLH